jgi:hypothetical protein
MVKRANLDKRADDLKLAGVGVQGVGQFLVPSRVHQSNCHASLRHARCRGPRSAKSPGTSASVSEFLNACSTCPAEASGAPPRCTHQARLSRWPPANSSQPLTLGMPLLSPAETVDAVTGRERVCRLLMSALLALRLRLDLSNGLFLETSEWPGYRTYRVRSPYSRKKGSSSAAV